MTLGSFFDPLALAIVGGGTFLATLLRGSVADLVRAARATLTLRRPPFSADRLLNQVAALARIARRQGVVTLDRSVVIDPDVAAAIAAIVDGAPPEHVAEQLRHARLARMERHAASADTWAGAAEAAPAMGMIGTLVGLARMFADMAHPAAIGGAMAVALLATLYGAIAANLVLQPVAVRLRTRARVEAFERLRLESPLVTLAAREQPRMVQGAAA